MSSLKPLYSQVHHHTLLGEPLRDPGDPGDNGRDEGLKGAGDGEREESVSELRRARASCATLIGLSGPRVWANSESVSTRGVASPDGEAKRSDGEDNGPGSTFWGRVWGVGGAGGGAAAAALATSASSSASCNSHCIAASDSIVTKSRASSIAVSSTILPAQGGRQKESQGLGKWECGELGASAQSLRSRRPFNWIRVYLSASALSLASPVADASRAALLTSSILLTAAATRAGSRGLFQGALAGSLGRRSTSSKSEQDDEHEPCSSSSVAASPVAICRFCAAASAASAASRFSRAARAASAEAASAALACSSATRSVALCRDAARSALRSRRAQARAAAVTVSPCFSMTLSRVATSRSAMALI